MKIVFDKILPSFNLPRYAVPKALTSRHCDHLPLFEMTLHTFFKHFMFKIPTWTKSLEYQNIILTVSKYKIYILLFVRIIYSPICLKTKLDKHHTYHNNRPGREYRQTWWGIPETVPPSIAGCRYRMCENRNPRLVWHSTRHLLPIRHRYRRQLTSATLVVHGPNSRTQESLHLKRNSQMP